MTDLKRRCKKLKQKVQELNQENQRLNDENQRLEEEILQMDKARQEDGLALDLLESQLKQGRSKIKRLKQQIHEQQADLLQLEKEWRRSEKRAAKAAEVKDGA